MLAPPSFQSGAQPYRRCLGALLMALLVTLLGPAASARAQPGRPPSLTLTPAADTIAVFLSCPTPAPELLITLDGRIVAPLALTTAAPVPPALVLLIEHSAALDRAQLDSARAHAALLLDLAPPGTSASLVSFAGAARLELPPTTDLATVRAALTTLDPQSAVATTTSRAAALELALAQLALAPTGPQALVLFSATITPADLAKLSLAPVSPRLLLLHYAADSGAPSALARAITALGGTYLPDAALDHAWGQQPGAALLAPGAALQLTLPTAGLASGSHQLSVKGCGAPLEATFTMPTLRPLRWLLALVVAIVASAGGGWFAAHHQFTAPTTPAPAAPPPGPAEITTARRLLTLPAPNLLRAIIWDGHSRRSVALHGRQWSLGADPGCDLCVADAGLAPLHARLSLVGDQIEVTALEAAVFHTGLGCALPTDLATPLGDGEALLLGTAVRLTIEAA